MKSINFSLVFILLIFSFRNIQENSRNQIFDNHDVKIENFNNFRQESILSNYEYNLNNKETSINSEKRTFKEINRISNLSMATVIGTDDRIRVNQTTSFPWNSIVKLEIDFVYPVNPSW